ncbi:protein of unknown function [Candidatus Filomicrobium marinum]|nr:protein of unknown function [Candidatus Filomicrobium marinum]
MTLPYFDVHLIELGPAFPVRSIPRGKIQRLVPTSFFQSMDRAVMTCPFAPKYTARVQASAVEEVINRGARMSANAGYNLRSALRRKTDCWNLIPATYELFSPVVETQSGTISSVLNDNHFNVAAWLTISV